MSKGLLWLRQSNPDHQLEERTCRGFVLWTHAIFSNCWSKGWEPACPSGMCLPDAMALLSPSRYHFISSGMKHFSEGTSCGWSIPKTLHIFGNEVSYAEPDWVCLKVLSETLSTWCVPALSQVHCGPWAQGIPLLLNKGLRSNGHTSEMRMSEVLRRQKGSRPVLVPT